MVRCSFCIKFSSVLKFDEHSFECVHKELLDYRTMRIEKLQPCVFEEAVIADKSNDDHKEYYHLSQFKNPAASNFLSSISRARLVLLLLPSLVLRVFSLVNKNKREGSDKNRLNIEGSLSSTLAVKLNEPESVQKCYEYNPDSDLLHEAKKATTKYNREHGKTLFIFILLCTLAFNIISLSHTHYKLFFKVGNYGKCRAGLEEPTRKRVEEDELKCIANARN